METPDRPVVKIPLSEINSKTYNIRGQINPQSCVDLAARIKLEGLNNPVQVARVTLEELADNDNKPYRLIAGFRRFMAHRINKAETIDARIYDNIDPVEAVVINFTENISREDLTLMQEARGVDHLRRMRNMTQKELASALDKSPKWVQIRLWALDLEPAIQKDIEQGLLKTNHIEKLKALPEGQPRYDYVKQVKSAMLTGDKPRVSLTKKNVFGKRRRDRTEIFEMQDHILHTLAGGAFSRLPEEAKLIIRFLGWTAGEVTDIEIYGYLRKVAENHNLEYTMPEAALASMQG